MDARIDAESLAEGVWRHAGGPGGTQMTDEGGKIAGESGDGRKRFVRVGPEGRAGGRKWPKGAQGTGGTGGLGA